MSAGFFDDDRKKENIIPFTFFCCLTTLVVAEALPSATLVGVVPHGLFIPHKGETIGPPMIAANIIVCKSSEASMR